MFFNPNVFIKLCYFCYNYIVSTRKYLNTIIILCTFVHIIVFCTSIVHMWDFNVIKITLKINNILLYQNFVDLYCISQIGFQNSVIPLLTHHGHKATRSDLRFGKYPNNKFSIFYGNMVTYITSCYYLQLNKFIFNFIFINSYK